MTEGDENYWFIDADFITSVHRRKAFRRRSSPRLYFYSGFSDSSGCCQNEALFGQVQRRSGL
jgi:hypothetical protein